MPFVTQHMSLPRSTPPAVPNMNAAIPMANMPRVSRRRNICAVAVAPTDMPRNIVTIFISSFCAVLESLSTTPLSRMRLPSMSIPTRLAAEGTSSAVNMVTTIGKTIFSVLETGLSCCMTMRRSFLVVSAFITGGCMSGTSAMYEYAAMAMEPRYSGASLLVTNMAVGPPAPPMMPMEPATPSLKPKSFAPMNATNMPNCAAAPRSRLLGLAMSGPKSVIAPTPRKMRQG